MAKIIEIERRFLTVADDWRTVADRKPKLFIEQCYPDSLQKDGVFGRVRSTLHPDGRLEYKRGDKESADGLKTPEDEWSVTELAFSQMKLAAGEKHLRKWRWMIDEGEPKIMVDQFTHIRNDRCDFVITEIEFSGDDAEARALAYTPPSWVGREISGNHHWSNYAMCTRGIHAR
jgi:CYTH domain-containing protein